MRKYQRIWEQIKLSNTASVEADVSKHARIIKATRKEKHKDIAYRFLMLEKGKKMKLLQEIEGNRITFTLEATVPTLYTL